MSNVKVGRTIAQKWEKQESESERLQNRKKAKGKKIVRVLSVLVILIGIGVVVAMNVFNWAEKRKKIEQETPSIVPVAQIIDESGAGVTKRMKEYVGTVEQDLADLGYTVDRAVLPSGKTREIDLFLKDYPYYFKLNIDRAAAVSAEDMKRMISYLTEHDVHPSYVDVRVKGKAYYK